MTGAPRCAEYPSSGCGPHCAPPPAAMACDPGDDDLAARIAALVGLRLGAGMIPAVLPGRIAGLVAAAARDGYREVRHALLLDPGWATVVYTLSPDGSLRIQIESADGTPAWAGRLITPAMAAGALP